MMDYMEKKCIDIPIQVAKENLAGVKSVKILSLSHLNGVSSLSDNF